MPEHFRNLCARTFAVATLLLTGTTAAAPVQQSHTEIALVSDVLSVQPGHDFWVAIHMKLEDGWHAYWQNPGDSGMPAKVMWELPVGFQAGELQWPFPERVDYPNGLTSYVLNGEIFLLSKITPAADLKDKKTATLKAHVRWLVCHDLCVPGKADLSLDLPLKAATPKSNRAIRKALEQTTLDWPLEQNVWTVKAYNEPRVLRLELTTSQPTANVLAPITFFPLRNDLIDHTAHQTLKLTDTGYALTVPKSTIAPAGIDQLKGVLVYPGGWQGNGLHRALAVDVPLEHLSGDILVGAPAPDFSVPDTNGLTRTLSDYKGSFIVLEWFNPDCPFVRKHYDSQHIQSLQAKYTQKGVIWLSINSSAPGKQGYYSPEEINVTMARRSANQTAVVLDPSGDLGRLYGAKTTPQIFVIDPEGILIYQGALDSIASTNPQDITAADNYVAMVLDAAMAGRPAPVVMTKSYGCSVKY